MENCNKTIEILIKDIEALKQNMAQCRRGEQKLDHDILNQQQSKIKEIENSNKEFRQETKSNITILFDKFEQLAGNVNQSMVIIKDFQENSKVKIGIYSAIISGVISTILAALILWMVASSVRQEEYNSNSEIKHLIKEIGNKVDLNADKLKLKK